MDDEGPRYSYLQVVHLFRRFYRECYMNETLGHGARSQSATFWPRTELSLRGVLPRTAPDYERINNSLLVVTYRADLGSEIWAMNHVIPAGNRLIGHIAVDRQLYVDVVNNREDAQKRKAILAHEWLEVIYNICNYSQIDGSRSVVGRENLLALMGALQFGLPWEDTSAHIARLAPALRDLLVSSETIHRLINAYPDFGSMDVFYQKFASAMRQGSGIAVPFLQRFAEHVSIHINVPRRLVEERLDEVLKLRL